MYIQQDQGPLLGRKGKGPTLLVTYQDPALRVNPRQGLLGATDYDVVFGQSASPRPAVTAVQQALHALATSTGNADYNPGPVDGAYGENTHAAIIRAAKDFLEPAGLSTASCRSLCNTLASSAKSACGDCMTTVLGALGSKVPGLGISAADIASVVSAYKEWLDAYIAKYGEGGALDPMVIANQEGVSREEAERLAAERTAAAAAAAAALATGEIPSGAPATAKFPWLAVVLVTVVIGGTAAAGWWLDRKGKRGVTTPPPHRERLYPVPWLSETPTRIGMPAARRPPRLRAASTRTRTVRAKARSGAKKRRTGSKSRRRVSYRSR